MKPSCVNLGSQEPGALPRFRGGAVSLPSPGPSRRLDARPTPAPVPTPSPQVPFAVPARSSASWRHVWGSRDSGPCRPARRGASLPALETLRFPTVFHIHITFHTLLGSDSTEPANYFHAPSQGSQDHGLHRASPGDGNDAGSLSVRPRWLPSSLLFWDLSPDPGKAVPVVAPG